MSSRKEAKEDIVSLGKDIEVKASDIEKSTKPMQPIHAGYFEYEHAKTTKSVVDDLNLEGLGKICKFFTNLFLIFRYKIQNFHSTLPVKLDLVYQGNQSIMLSLLSFLVIMKFYFDTRAVYVLIFH